MKHKVYKLVCSGDDSFYIGVTCNPKKRLAYHKSASKTGRHSNKFFMEKVNQYGEESISMEIIAEFKDREDAELFEDSLLYIHINDEKCLNIQVGSRMSSEHKSKLVSKMKELGMPHTREKRIALSRALGGHAVRGEHPVHGVRVWELATDAARELGIKRTTVCVGARNGGTNRATGWKFSYAE